MMVFFRKSILLIFFLTLNCLANENLTQEVERLRNSLTPHDPNRAILTLRLADMIFDRINELTRTENLDATSQKIIRQYIQRDLSLYLEALNGNGFQPGASGVLRYKILFQLGRLYAELAQTKQANEIWDELVKNSELIEIKREAALRLAEFYESESIEKSLEKADSYYKQAIELCPKGDSCYYAHYKRAWLFHRIQQHEKAISELEYVLWDSKGQPREEALRDLILFWSQSGGDGKLVLIKIEELSAKLARSTLLLDLANAYFAAGNKPAGVLVLELVNSRNPSLRHQIRLLEEYYGMRRWNDFRNLLLTTSEQAKKDRSISVDDERILRRLTLQLDGERATNTELVSDFKQVVLLYLELFPKTEIRNQLRFTLAKIFYEQKELEKALPIFQELALATELDQYAIQSEHLALDILNQQKRLTELIAQADFWIKNEKIKSSPQLKKDVEEVEKIKQQAYFEWATSLGNSPQALGIFKDFCFQKQFLPKSCENAKILCRKLKNEKALISILESMDDKAELASEYEASGYFEKAAKVLEKQSKQDFKNLLKISLLYELAGQAVERDRLLKQVVLNKQKFQPEEEDLIIQSLIDANLIRQDLLNWPFKETNKRRIAYELEKAQKGNAVSRKILLDSTDYLGPVWSKLVIEELGTIDGAQRKLGFYGKRGKLKFELRLEALKKLVKQAERYLNGADVQARAEILKQLTSAHEDLAKEIIESPVPNNISAEAVAQITASLTEMAKPFLEKAAAYTSLMKEQQAKSVVSHQPVPLLDTQKFSQKEALEALHQDPLDIKAVEELQNYYSKQGHLRLAYYFKGRLSQLQGEQNSAKP